jgi:hypothetical protein
MRPLVGRTILSSLYLSIAPAAELLAQDVRVEVAAGAGFAGLRLAEAIQQPALDCNGQNVCTPASGFTDLVRNIRYVWRPALSPGVIFRFLMLSEKKQGDKSDDDVMIGLGAHMVFVPIDEGTRPLPSFTIHIGKKNTQVFGGVLLGSADDVVFPGNAKQIRVPSTNIPSLVRSNASEGPNFYFGIVIQGVSVTKPPTG